MSAATISVLFAGFAAVHVLVAAAMLVRKVTDETPAGVGHASSRARDSA